MIGVSGERLVTKKRQSSSWRPMAIGATKYSVMESATFPFASRRDLGVGVGVVVIPRDWTSLRSANALAEHPLSTKPTA
jgi:hypothetical protein